MKNTISLFILLLGLSSCTALHNVPKTEYPNRVETSSLTYSYVDQNGNFYPDNWSKKYGTPVQTSKIKEYSLKKIATENGTEVELSASEKNKISKVASSGKNKNRIFIFVHGFNASSDDVTKSYNYIKSQLNTGNRDQIINFYWDGLVANSLFSVGKIWFNAANNSQMAGEFGLRRLLNSYQGKNIYIISHSRGASVVLSALSNPPFSKAEIEQRKDLHNVDIDNDSKTLKENKNNFYCIMLGPAIGVRDFKSENLKAGDDTYREFSPQLKKIHITVNNTDRTLKKFIGFLSDKLKPTDLGYKSEAFEELKQHYDFLEKTDFTGQKSHNFDLYIRNPKFQEILKEFKIAK